MSEHADELNRRLQSGEPLAVTWEWFRSWYCREDQPPPTDLTQEERKFLVTCITFKSWLEG